jgi:hypothetical protein
MYILENIQKKCWKNPRKWYNLKKLFNMGNNLYKILWVLSEGGKWSWQWTKHAIGP